MKTARCQILLLGLAGIVMCSGITTAQQQTVTLTEPSPVKIQELFKQADLVAVVRILSGDTEQYPTAVYKAKVVQSFKGIDVGGQSLLWTLCQLWPRQRISTFSSTVKENNRTERTVWRSWHQLWTRRLLLHRHVPRRERDARSIYLRF